MASAKRCAACGKAQSSHTSAQAMRCSETLNASGNVDPAEQVMMADEIAAFMVEEQTYKSREEVERYKRKASELTRDLSRALREKDELRASLDLINSIEDQHTKPAPWAAPKARAKGNRGIPTLLLSDLHLDEVVNPDEIEGLNSFNRAIAEQRLKRTFEKAITTTRDHLTGVSYDGFQLFLGGDLISGAIHEELVETNECPVPATVDYWLDPLAAGIGMLADHFGKVHIAGVVGNHGRTTRKPRAKQRVHTSIDWLIMKMLMRDFRNDSRVTWQVPDSPDCMVNVYNTRYLLTHGDQAHGGSGVAGMLSPLMLMQHRKSKRSMETSQGFDWLVMGHWHSYFSGKGLIVNGALKGYDEYASVSNFSFEPPAQAMWITTPEHGVTFSWPVFCQDRKKEGW